MTDLHIIWFRQDLRVHDHAALRAACQSAERDGGEVMALYILPKPASDEAYYRNAEAQFLIESLRDLQGALEQRGAVLHLRHGDAIEVLSDLHRKDRVLSLHLHDTWNDDPSMRDMETWALRAGIPLRIFEQFGPPKAARDQGPWLTLWERFMARPRHEAPDSVPTANVGIGQWPRAASTDLMNKDPEVNEPGGRKQAIQKLRAFLGTTSTDQASALSSADAFDALKPYLQIGAVSLREVWQAAIGAHQQALKGGFDIRAASIASFLQVLPSVSHTSAAKERRHRAYRPASSGQRQAAPGQQLTLGLGEIEHQDKR